MRAITWRSRFPPRLRRWRTPPAVASLQRCHARHRRHLRLPEAAPGLAQLGDEAGRGERPDALDRLQRSEPGGDQGLELPAHGPGRRRLGVRAAVAPRAQSGQVLG